MKYPFLLITAVLIVAMAAIFMVAQKQNQKTHTTMVSIDGVVLPEPQTIADFHLTDHQGKAFTKENLKGHWTMLFFGFTNCGMICPTTMASLNTMYKTLEKELPASQLPQVVMISVDPERDTVKRMKDYVIAFNAHFIGVRGSMAATVALEKQLHIASAKMQAEGEGENHYTVNHSAEIMLFNPQGDLQAFMSYPHQAAQMVKDYRAILNQA